MSDDLPELFWPANSVSGRSSTSQRSRRHLKPSTMIRGAVAPVGAPVAFFRVRPTAASFARDAPLRPRGTTARLDAIESDYTLPVEPTCLPGAYQGSSLSLTAGCHRVGRRELRKVCVDVLGSLVRFAPRVPEWLF